MTVWDDYRDDDRTRVVADLRVPQADIEEMGEVLGEAVDQVWIGLNEQGRDVHKVLVLAAVNVSENPNEHTLGMAAGPEDFSSTCETLFCALWAAIASTEYDPLETIQGRLDAAERDGMR